MCVFEGRTDSGTITSMNKEALILLVSFSWGIHASRWDVVSSSHKWADVLTQLISEVSTVLTLDKFCVLINFWVRKKKKKRDYSATQELETSNTL